MVENISIANERRFLDPLEENGKELKSENNGLPTHIDQLTGEFWRIDYDAKSCHSDENIKDGKPKYILFWTKYYAWSSMLSQVIFKKYRFSQI